MAEISSESNPQIKEIVKLQKSARERRKKQLFIVEGFKLTREAAEYGRLQKIYFSESAVAGHSGEWNDIMARYPYVIVRDSVFRMMSETVTPQGVLGLVQMPFYELNDIVQDEKRSILLLDDLRDAGNLGTIIRTAEGADMSGVILSKESADLFNPKTVRSTMGAVFRMPFYYAEDLVYVIGKLKERGLPVYGAMLQGSILYYEADYQKGAAIVVGNEANGISARVSEALNQKVRIPMAGNVESLNAAVSAALLMYEIFRQKNV